MTPDDENRLRSFARESVNLQMLFEELDRTRALLKDTVIDLGKAQEDRNRWRDTVRLSPGYFYSSVYRVTCPYCCVESSDEEREHKADCPWLLAQESE